MYRKFLEDDQEGVDEIVDKLEDFAERPEAAQCKEEIKKVADALKNSKAAFDGLAKLEETFLESGVKTAAERRQYIKDRSAATDAIKAAFGKGPPPTDGGAGGGGGADGGGGAGGKGAEQGTARDGPWYDPDDDYGAVLAANRLEQSFSNARQLLQSMMLRQQEVENARVLKKQILDRTSVQSRMPNPLLQANAPEDDGAGGVLATDDFRRQMQARFGKGDVTEHYEARARMYDVSMEEDMLLDAVGLLDAHAPYAPCLDSHRILR